MKFFLALLLAACLATTTHAQLPSTMIYVAQFYPATLAVKNAKPLSSRTGYINQPSFSIDGTFLLFVMDVDSSTDVFSFDLKSGTITQITRTIESEFSPTPLLQGGFSAVQVGAPNSKGDTYTESQKLWYYADDGTPLNTVSSKTRVGYHGWLNASTVAEFIVGNEELKTPHSLILCDLKKNSTLTITQNIGRTLQRMGSNEAILLIDKSDTSNFVAKRLNIDGTITTLFSTGTSEDVHYVSDDIVLYSKDNSIIQRSLTPSSVPKIIYTHPDSTSSIKRLCVNGKWIAFVVGSKD